MNDLFTFLKELIRDQPEVIAAFVMGLIVAVLFLSYPIYRLAAWFNGKKKELVEAELKKVNDDLKEEQQDLAETKRKAKERKTKLEEKQIEIGELNAKAETAKQNEAKTNQALQAVKQKHLKVQKDYDDLVPKYNKLGRVATYWKKQSAALDDQAKLIEKMQGQLWAVPVDKDKIAPFRPLKKNGPVIIAVTNLKGGVGKTTLTANVAITYCSQKAKRVLVIDLDFQASLTNLCLSVESVSELSVGHGRLIDNVFKDFSPDAASLAFSNVSQTREPKLHLLAASENLASIEERSKARWLMNPGSADLRSVLRSALHHETFQDRFDVILIDCPPRWTTSSINAIACSDYVLIPTQLDRVSSEAVPRLLKWLREMQSVSPELYGQIKILGVLANRAYPREGMIEQEREIWKSLPEKCEKAWGKRVHFFGTIVKDKAEFRRAANHRQFAALHADLKPVFLTLADEIEGRRRDDEGI